MLAIFSMKWKMKPVCVCQSDISHLRIAFGGFNAGYFAQNTPLLCNLFISQLGILLSCKIRSADKESMLSFSLSP